VLRLVARACAFILLACLLASCGELIDAGEARLCRQVLPALDNQGARLVLDQTRPGPFPNSVRIDYRAIREGGPTRIRFAVCVFSPGRDARGARELIGVATEFGPMAGASFFFLKRYFLESREGPPPDPAPPAAAGALEVPFWFAYGAQFAGVALPAAAIYALLAAAYALIYGLVGRIVLVFGEFAALGSLAGVVAVVGLALLGVASAGVGVAAALGVGVAAAALHGRALSRLALTRLARAPGQHVLIASVGAGMALTEYLRLMQGAETRWLPPLLNQPLPLMRAGDFVTTVTVVGLLAAGFGLACTAGLLVVMRRSGFGRQWRAVADDAGAAALFGVDERRVFDKALIIAAGLAGLAGVVVTVLNGGMGFAGGFALGLKALIAAILGGVGSIGGAALGGLAVALIEAAWSATMPIEARDAVIYLLLSLVLILRPGGFFGDGDLSPRRV
jgi:branched-subunit amino acid ABC-type transport system permease component